MKAIIDERSACFTIALTAENLQEAALITRFGMNTKKQLKHINSYATKDGDFTSFIVVAGRSKGGAGIPRR